MSTEERLKRLGLEHLKDKPEELQAEIERRLQIRHQKEEEWEKLHGKQPEVHEESPDSEKA